MRIDFNPAKDAINRKQHEGLSLGLANHFDWLTARILPARTVDGEVREQAIVLLDGIVYSAIYTRRADVLWIISVRRASRKERRLV